MARRALDIDKVITAREQLQTAVDALSDALPVNVDEGTGQPMVRLSVDLPEDLHLRLKIWCIRRRRTMGDAARAWIEHGLEAG